MRSKSNKFVSRSVVSRRVLRLTLAASAALSLGLVGCQSALVSTGPTSLPQELIQSAPADASTTQPADFSDPSLRMAFWQTLPSRKITSNDDAITALLLYHEGKAPASYDARLARVKELGWVGAEFNPPASAAVTRGDLAVAMAKLADIKGGLTTRIFGHNPRHATRAMEYVGVYPESSPQQVFSGAEFVSVMGKLEDYQRGDPARAPAEYLPSELDPDGKPLNPTQTAAARAVRPDVDLSFPNDEGIVDVPKLMSNTTALLMQAPPDATIPLIAQVTGVEGDLVEARMDENSPWEKVFVGMELDEGAELRTGDKSAIRFIIPPGQRYVLDRLGSAKILRANFESATSKVNTEVGMAQGRLRLDVDRPPAGAPVDLKSRDASQPIRVEAAGIAYDSRIKSPNAALAVRGTRVSLIDQPGFDPTAVSLEGRAVFQNTSRKLVNFGGTSKASVSGDQNSPAQAAFATSLVANQMQVDATDREAREIGLLVSRGGFTRGDVSVGDSNLSDAEVASIAPGELNFVLRWNGGPTRQLNDLNLAIISPLNQPSNPDFVANPPFTISLTPGNPEAEAIRAERYPRTSRSGGSIGRNHVGPEGLEIASWKANYPRGQYIVGVFNLVDSRNPPAPDTVTSRVPYTVDVFVAGQVIPSLRLTGQVGQLETQVQAVVIDDSTTSPQVQTASVGKKSKAKNVGSVKDVTQSGPALPALANSPGPALPTNDVTPPTRGFKFVASPKAQPKRTAKNR